MGKRSILIGVVAAAMLLGVTAGTASAAQPDLKTQRVAPLSNACLKAGGVWRAAFSQSGQPVHLDCSKTTGFSDDELARLTRACGQVAADFGATQFFVGAGVADFTCDLFF